MPRIALAVLALLAAGCGGPSREEFVADADQVCGEIERRLDRFGENVNSPAQFRAQVGEAKRTLETGARRLRELDTPEGEAGETAERFVAALSREVTDANRALDDLARAIAANDAAGITAAGTRISRLDEGESNRLARQLRMRECGSGAPTGRG